MLPYLYSSQVLPVSVSVLRGKVSVDPRNTTKSDFTTSFTRDLSRGKNPGEWMPLLRQEVAENWAEDGVYIGFLGMGTWSVPGWGLVEFQAQSVGFLLWKGRGLSQLGQLECSLDRIWQLEVFEGGAWPLLWPPGLVPASHQSFCTSSAHHPLTVSQKINRLLGGNNKTSKKLPHQKRTKQQTG